MWATGAALTLTLLLTLTALLVVLWNGLGVFWIDPLESGTQISVAITTMLTLIAYRFAVGAFLPRISYLTRLDFFILASTFLVYCSLIQVVVTSWFAKSERVELARRIDLWARFLFPAVFALVALKTLVLGIFL